MSHLMKRALSSIFNHRSTQALTWGAVGAQVGLDVGAAAVLTGVVVATAPVTLAFAAVAGLAAGAVVGFGSFKKKGAPAPA